MSIPLLIIAASGGGKSTAIKTLPPKETFLINVCNKELPFRGSKTMYTEFNKGNLAGNKLSSDDYDAINKTISYVHNDRKEIKYIVIDDSQYLIVNEFLKKHSIKGKGNDVFMLYNDIADNFWKLIWSSKLLRDDLFVIFLHHCETDEFGQVKAKTIGKMLDEKINIPGMFTVVLYGKREGNKNFFFTQNDGTNPAKSPEGMFTDLKIPNDLLYVTSQIKPYYEGQ